MARYVVQFMDAIGVWTLSSHEDEREAIAAAKTALNGGLPQRPGGHGTIIEVADELGQVWCSG